MHCKAGQVLKYVDSQILALSVVNLAGKGPESQVDTNITVTAQERDAKTGMIGFVQR